MPIKGLDGRSAQLRRLGHLKLGPPKVEGQRLRALDYFRCDPVEPEYAEQFHELYGERPTRLPVVFPSDDADVTLSLYYRCFRFDQTCICRGDGTHALRINEDTDSLDEQVDCPGPLDCDFALARGPRPKPGKKQKPGCKHSAYLRVILPEFPVYGVWQVNTKSIYGILNILAALGQLRGAAGRIAMLPAMVLVLEPRKIKVPDVRGPQVKPILDIEIPMSLEKLAAAATKNLEALPAGVDHATTPLIGPYDDDDDDDADTETGEVLPAADAPPASIDQDPDVQKALKLSRFSEGKRQAVIKSALEGGWDKDTTISFIEREMAKATGGRPPTTAPATGGGGQADTAETEDTGGQADTAESGGTDGQKPLF